MTALTAFSGFGVEIEYCIVGINDLECRPIADRILADIASLPVSETDPAAWSNEFALHVLEMKNPSPVGKLEHLVSPFQRQVGAVNDVLRPHGGRLMPTSMHPWMNPLTDMRHWEVDPFGVYRAYRRIFDTRSHGWGNLQSMHLNLPFADDAEFVRLHESIRLLLPIIPSLCASSGIADGRVTAYRDFRMHCYRHNAAAYPLITGCVIPDSVESRAAYETTILEPMYASLAAQDPRGALRYDWLNSRGAIPRFDRNSIEIRVIDSQECPAADLAVAAAITAAVHQLFENSADQRFGHKPIPTGRLVRLFDACVRFADHALIDDVDFLSLFGFSGQTCRAGDLWRHIMGRFPDRGVIDPSVWAPHWAKLIDHGCLAHRIELAAGPEPSRMRLQSVYRELCECLDHGEMFRSP
ncbi:glutamate-cysteine ligase family protein [Microvirga antarctica]|uniref:glutamate-cysteine ligase family protein n=1 Tax=Microvirga antarctica TaxID=2819233 RepID=UPI001B303405|nr:glutamate-cysteine ligase family protein [Microvirga antarctica]